MTNRPGFSIAELIVGLVVASLVSASLVQLMVTQSRFMTTQEGRSNARAVSRSSTGLILSDTRMVQTTGGVAQAHRDSVTFRIPFAQGIICGNTLSATDVLIPPVDSLVYAEGTANFAGYGWRDSNNVLTYVETGVSLATGASSSCTSGTNPIVTSNLPTGTRIVRVSPIILGGFRGAPVFLHQRISYAFRPSASVPGRRGLYRTRVAAGLSEELVAPFDTAARFLFFWADSANSNPAPPASLNDLRGIELFLVGVNERAANPTAAETSPLRTAVFFKN